MRRKLDVKRLKESVRTRGRLSVCRLRVNLRPLSLGFTSSGEGDHGGEEPGGLGK